MKEQLEGICERCGAPRHEDAAVGLCPRCLMVMNFASRTMAEGEAPIPADPLPSEDLADRFPQYEILECLGRGGMGVVYKARQKALDRLVAIKLLAGEWQDDAKFSARFEHEAKILAQMNHPNIVTVHDFGVSDGCFFIVMEFVDGVNLRNLLQDGRMEPKQALAIVPPVCEALEYAHSKGVVHRDIKPENILLDCDGRVKIADFGIAALVSITGERSGTPPYMAPEQEAGSVDRRADVYALGVVLYEMLTGESPGKDPTAPLRKVSLDIRIDEMVLRALEREPERRYQTVGELRTAVETIVHPSAEETSGENAVEDGEGPNAKVRKTRRNRRKKVVLRLFDTHPTKASLLSVTLVCLATAAVMLVAVDPEWGYSLLGLSPLPIAESVPVEVRNFIEGSWLARAAIGAAILVFVAGCAFIVFFLVRKIATVLDAKLRTFGRVPR